MDSRRGISGVDLLKAKISKLPAGSRITIVAKKLAKGNGAERFEYSPSDTQEEIVRYAQTRGIQVENPFQEGDETLEWWVLYSWKSDDGEWGFRLWPGYISRLPSVQEITGEDLLRGAKALERRLADCRPKTRILLARKILYGKVREPNACSSRPTTFSWS
jgi:hypothetical protein